MRRAAANPIHPLGCDCTPCRGPRFVRIAERPSVVEAADVDALLWGFATGAVIAALLILNKFGPAVFAWLLT